MDMSQKSSPDKDNAQEIDLIELVLRLWGERRFLCKCCSVAISIGLVIAFSMPKEYITTVKLVPETSDLSKKMGNLGGLAAMAGISLPTSSGADAISPVLYPDVVQSVPFLLELFPIEVNSERGDYSATLYDYMLDHQREAWWYYVVYAPFRFLGWVRELLSEEEPLAGNEPTSFRLTKEQAEIVEGLQGRISAFVDRKTHVITVSVRMQDPLISATLARLVVENLQGYITDYRTQKVRQDLEFTEKVFGEARESYYKAQRAYATFEDANKNIISASYRTEQERLKNEMSLAFNVYNTLAQKLEQDKLRVQEQTPVYAVISPATVPLKPVSPKKWLILAASVFLAVAGAVGYLFVKDLWEVKRELRKICLGKNLNSCCGTSVKN